MGIQIGGGKRKRRSYADYKPPSRTPRPRSDPFRVVFYLVCIAGVVWVYTHPEIVHQQVREGISEAAEAVGPTQTPTTDPANFASLAEQAYHDGLLDEAIEQYRQAGEFAPNNVEYHVQVARLLLFRSALEYGLQQAATLEEALEAADRAILANPEDPGGYAILGKIKDWQGRPDEALSDIQRALELKENYAVGHSYLAEALLDLQRWDQAQASIDQALAIEPNHVDVRRDYGYILESLGDYAGAATQYETALQVEPNLPHIRMALGRVYRVNGRFDESLDQFFAVETLFPAAPLVPYEVGRTYETYVGDPVTALEYYQRATDLDESFAPGWVRSGILYYFAADYEQAIAAFETALELGVEDNIDLEYQLGLAYANTGQCAKALPHLNKARSLAADDERILDAVSVGFETCSLPTPTSGPPAAVTPTP